MSFTDDHFCAKMDRCPGVREPHGDDAQVDVLHGERIRAGALQEGER